MTFNRLVGSSNLPPPTNYISGLEHLSHFLLLATWGKRGEMDNISTAPVFDPSRRNRPLFGCILPVSIYKFVSLKGNL